jgi:hypothetical protein
MTSEPYAESSCEAVAVFDTAASLEAAADELLSSGFDQADLSLLAGEHAVEEKLGHRYRKVEEIEDEAGVPRTAYIATEAMGDAEGALIGGLTFVGGVSAAGAMAAAGGPLAGIIVAAAAAGGAGGLIGSALAKFLGQHHADQISEHLKKGGLLLWVRARDKGHESRATEILKKHGGRDVHLHELAAHKFSGAT